MGYVDARGDVAGIIAGDPVAATGEEGADKFRCLSRVQARLHQLIAESG
jgi:hypothetical protein